MIRTIKERRLHQGGRVGEVHRFGRGMAPRPLAPANRAAKSQPEVPERRLFSSLGRLFRRCHDHAESPFADQEYAASGTSVAIGRAAAAGIESAANISGNSGNTTLAAARHRYSRPKVTRCTKSLPLLCLRQPIRWRVVAQGGKVRRLSRALVGAIAVSRIRRAIHGQTPIGASGYEVRHGANTTESLKAAIKPEAIKRSRGALLPADALKWEFPAALQFAGRDQFATLVIDTRLNPPERRMLAKAGAEIAPAVSPAAR